MRPGFACITLWPDVWNCILKKKSDYGMFFWLHLTVIVLAWTAPFVLNWKLILFGVFLYYFQLGIFGYCVLTKMEFGEKKERGVSSFYAYYLNKCGFKIGEDKVVSFVDYLQPWIILGIALGRECLIK